MIGAGSNPCPSSHARLPLQTVDIYGQDNCFFCGKAKALCDAHGIPYRYHNVTDPALLARMQMIAPERKTVPQIAVGAKYIGGYNEFYAMVRDGTIQQMIGGE